MLDIRVLASSSAGCAYVVSDGDTRVLLECGIRYRQIQEGVGFRVSELAGCLVSHEHQDHCRAVAPLMRAGVDVYASRGTWRAIGADGHRAIPVPPREVFDLGTWRVLPFEAVHDAEEPLGFMLASGVDRLLYLTDTAYSPYRFDGLTYLMIECNYTLEMLRQNVRDDRINIAQKNRVLRNHMGLERVLAMLAANDLSRVEQIHLLHLSDTNSDEERFRLAVAAATGKPTFVAPMRQQPIGARQ